MKPLLIPFALSLAVSSCPQHEELPRNVLPVPQARAETAALDRTTARELRFSGSVMGESEIQALDTFLQGQKIREIKLILWFPPEASADELSLVRSRLSYVTGLLQAHRLPYEILMLESPYYEDSQGSVLAILD